ncbi:MAG: metal-sensing transcriptional repressor [Clostridiales bacterium]|nr:metal-sensing transcriptional repressor [Clostridiales bacterium]
MRDKSCSCDCNHSGDRKTAREDKLRASLISRINRIEGQVRGIRGMIEKDVYCDDVLNQISAAQAALGSVSRLLLESHMRGCLAEKIRNGDDSIIDELIITIGKMMR